MTKRLLLWVASFGCFCPGSSALAQSDLNAIAMRNGTSTATDMPTDAVHFCGESIPTHQPAVAERWTRTLSRQASMAGSLAVLKRRASVVFPLIEPILKQYQIPADFKFLPLLESAVTNNAVSRRGAAGFWQLMPQTAQSLGLTVSRGRDERFNLRKATHAACRYISDLYHQLGSWMLVATAYNAGPTYIQNLVRRHPNQHPIALPYRAAETKAYLYQAVAIKELITRPTAYRTYLSTYHVAALSDAQTIVSTDERSAILHSFDEETNTSDNVASALRKATFVTDLTNMVVLLTDDDETADTLTNNAPALTATPTAQPVPDATPTMRLMTRSLSEGTLTEGQFCTFIVVQPTTLYGRAMSVGDVIQAHVEVIDAASGRVFLRTDRLTTAQTGESYPLRLVATGQPHQPGAPLPQRLDGWGLAWEAL